MTDKCRIWDCDRPVRCRGLCNLHRQRIAAASRPVHPCKCGCGGLTATQFISGHNTRLLSSAEQSRRGRKNDGSKQRDQGSKDGYRKVGGRHEHRTVAEKKLGRKLRKGEIVHHKDHNKKNNARKNLEVMTQAEHARLHMLGNKHAAKK